MINRYILQYPLCMYMWRENGVNISLWFAPLAAIDRRVCKFSVPDYQLAENLILVFSFLKRQKRDKSEFVTKSVLIIVTIIFI